MAEDGEGVAQLVATDSRNHQYDVCLFGEGAMRGGYGPFDTEQGSDLSPTDYILNVRSSESLLEGLFDADQDCE